MKKITLQSRSLLLVILFLVACSSGYAQETKVFVTKTGTKYHRETCRYLKYSKSELTLASAVQSGYDACKVCKPPMLSTTSDSTQVNTPVISTPANTKSTTSTGTTKQCSATTQKGTRCKRMTKNSSGKCWQHE